RDEPGTGAGGGVALPLLAWTQASITPGADLVCDAIELAEQIGRSDLVITGEGRLDRQSLMGKVVGVVGRLAQGGNGPCVAIVGCLGDGAEDCLSLIDDYVVLDAPLAQTIPALGARAEEVVRRWTKKK